MKKTLILLSILFTFNLAQSQNYKYGAVFTSTMIIKLSGNIKINYSIVSLNNIEKNKKIEAVAIGEEADMEIPTFPGGISEFYKFVAKNFKMPKNFNSNEKMIVSFIVEKDGSLSTFDVKKDLGSGTKEEAIRVLKSLKTKWSAGMKNGKNVRTEYVLPIKVKID
jgi:hypothetical protein